MEEHNPDTLRTKLKIMCGTLPDMPLERADSLMGQLKDSLSKSILESIKEAFAARRPSLSPSNST